MVREIVRDVLFLNQKSEPATEADKSVAQDLIDTLLAHKHECVGMAANMSLLDGRESCRLEIISLNF